VDLIACNGEDAHPITKVYWAFTEGIVASALLIAGGNDALKALQAVSIIAGVPFTGFVSLICLSINSVFRYDQGWTKKHEFLTWKVGLHGGIFDFVEWVFSAFRAPKPDPQHIPGFFICLFCPPLHMLQALKRLSSAQGREALSMLDKATVVSASSAWAGFIFMLIASWIWTETGLGSIAVFCYIAFVVWVTALRTRVRFAYRIEGWMLTDAIAAFFIYPQVIYQAFKEAEGPLPELPKSDPVAPAKVVDSNVKKEPPAEVSL